MTEQNIKFSDGASYDKMMGVWSRIVGLEFLKWLSPENGQKWLDIGCGTGAFTEQIIENCYPQEVRGVDPSEAQLEFAKNHASRKKAHFQVGDAMKLPFKADEFDVSAMALVIFFVADPAKGVGEMKRVVRSGGLVAAYTWDIFCGGFPLEPVHAVLRAKGIEYPLPASAEISRMVNLESLWKTVGFSSVEVCEINGERKFKDFENFWNLTSSSTALKPVWKNLDSLALLDVKNATRKNIKVKTEEKLILSSWANAIKGTV
jgi:ubiquinone/menaquinone biosynthesis C-methylase UbiE